MDDTHIKMHRLITAHLVLLLLCLCAASAAASGDVAAYSFPVFNATTTEGLVAATNSSVLTSAALLFDSLSPREFNNSEGFLLLSWPIDVWRAGDGGVPAREASFNTSFTVDGASSPVAFVLLLDRFPTFNNPVGLRGDANNSAAGAEANATNALAAVEVGTVRSYAPDSPNVGLNVTVTPNRTAPSRTVWIEYNAVAHRLWVYVAAGGQPRPPKALLDTPLDLAGLRTTQTAFVGFFAPAVRNVILGVRDWDLTVDRLDGDGKKGTPWLVILLAVLGSVAATAAIVSAVVCYFVSRRRALNMEQPKQ